MIRGHYFNTDAGQVHYREWLPTKQNRRPLLCLHPAPFSGLFFTTAMPLLGSDRRVIAPDYPGYGGSTQLEQLPDVASYAASMLRLVENIAPGQPVDLLGFHSGCLVAAEMALCGSDRIGSTVLVDVPYFTGETQAKMLQQAARPLELGTEPEDIASLWKSAVGVKAPLMGLARAVEMLSEQLRVFPRAHQAFHAAFTYPCEERFSELSSPVAIIATQSGLRDATLACAEVIASASLIEAPDITRGVFEEGAPAIAARIDAALAQLQGEARE